MISYMDCVIKGTHGPLLFKFGNVCSNCGTDVFGQPRELDDTVVRVDERGQVGVKWPPVMRKSLPESQLIDRAVCDANGTHNSKIDDSDRCYYCGTGNFGDVEGQYTDAEYDIAQKEFWENFGKYAIPVHNNPLQLNGEELGFPENQPGHPSYEARVAALKSLPDTGAESLPPGYFGLPEPQPVAGAEEEGESVADSTPRSTELTDRERQMWRDAGFDV